MDEDARRAVEAAGFRVGDYGDFLGLKDHERALVELRLALARTVRRLREAEQLSQGQLAKRMKSTQARVIKVEDASIEATLDLMFRALFTLGGTLDDLAEPSPTAEDEAKVGSTRG